MITLRLQKTALLKYISFTPSKDNSAHSLQATRLILVLKEAKWSALQKYPEFFSIFEFSKKLQLLEVENFYEKENILENRH